MKTAKEFAEDLRVQFEKAIPKPHQIYSIHNKIRNLTRTFDAPGPEMREVLDFNIPHDHFPVPVRLYIPNGASKGIGPCLVYLHGGGFVTCSVDSHESICLRLADGAGMRVLSVDYRLAPQYPFPAAPDDCEHVLKWTLGQTGAKHGINSALIAIGGDSAGGNMSAYLAQKYRKHLRAQVLFYPLLQMAEVKPIKPGPQDVLQLGEVALNFITKHYVAGADVNSTRISPLFEPNLKGVPPAYILTCGLDPLRLEGRLYASKLEAHGIAVTFRHEKTMPHGYLNFSRTFPSAKKLPLDTSAFLRDTLKNNIA